jgi:hypothetical protein
MTAHSPRNFSVHGVDEAPARSHLVEGLTFEDAALHFLNDRHVEVTADGDVALIVEDCETGERQCFRVDLATGETGPCE